MGSNGKKKGTKMGLERDKNGVGKGQKWGWLQGQKWGWLQGQK